MKEITFSSKANVLSQLIQYEELHISPLFVVESLAWQQDRLLSLDKAYSWAKEQSRPLAVRSSCTNEDSVSASAAGAFTSFLNIPCMDKDALASSIDAVFASYPDNHVKDQVLLQPMIEHIAVSGVIMTHVLSDGAPYYVINYDDESGSTDSITAGRGGTKTVYIYRDAQESNFDSQRLLSFVQLAKRIEIICNRNDLDIEFCQSQDGRLHVLQVRPICSQHQWIQAADKRVQNNIDFLVDFVEKRTKPWPELHGNTTILGVMPDWNPAEILGVTPRPLASSLYRKLITRNVWRKAREYMGYKTIPPEDLMIMLAGRPYIDVRISFNSFLPEGLDAVTGEALVCAWLAYLDKKPWLHDKIEFDIAQTTLDFCFHEHLNERYPNLLNSKREEHFKKCLQTLTNKCLNMGDDGSVAWSFNAISKLRNRQENQGQIPFDSMESHTLVPQIILLCEDCKNFGTLPFSILARHAFIAEALLRTAVEREAISQERLDAFRKSLQTVAGEMSHDFLRVSQNSMEQDDFLLKYGHLRPSSYDILSSRYADKNNFFSENAAFLPEACFDFTFTHSEQKNISKLMHEAGLVGDASSLEHYARKVIPGREWAKFVFTKNLSNILELIAHWGNRLELDRETLSFLDIRHILEWSSHALLQLPRTYFNHRAKEGRNLFDLSRSLKLGYLIRSSRDIYIVPQHRSTPNFIGNGKVEARVVLLHAYSDCSLEIANCLVCIENADPGFDWIFTRNIAGLITKFGGTNSHMAIRSAEYGLPAAIGVGEILFEKISQAQYALLNAGTHTLQPL